TREATVTSVTGPKGEDSWIQLDDKIQQGNSGGPLLDQAGNIIGVIAARAVIYTYKQSSPEEGVYTNSGIAISPKTLKSFLDDNRVLYRFTTNQINFSADRITDKAREFIVNVRCEMPPEGN